jgi:hypothetical protein
MHSEYYTVFYVITNGDDNTRQGFRAFVSQVFLVPFAKLLRVRHPSFISNFFSTYFETQKKKKKLVKPKKLIENYFRIALVQCMLTIKSIFT